MVFNAREEQYYSKLESKYPTKNGIDLALYNPDRGVHDGGLPASLRECLLRSTDAVVYTETPEDKR